MFKSGRSLGLRQTHQRKKCWPDQRFRSTIKGVITSNKFSNFILLIIVINAITIALEADYSLKNSAEGAHGILDALNVCDYLFLVIYIVEFLLKLYVYQWTFWQQPSYVFEVLILLIMLIQIIIDNAGVGDDGRVIVDILNIFKAVRIFRAVILFEGVQVLLTALLNTVTKSAGSLILLLAMLWLFFAVVGYYSFGYDEETVEINDSWGTLGNAIISLLTYLFAEGWVGIQGELNQTFPGSEYYAIIFIVIAHFIFINLFIGVIIMNIHDATERHNEAQRKEREMQLQLKKEYLYKRQHDDVHRMMEKQKTHQYDNFQEMTRDFFETLSHDDYVLMSDKSTNLMWLETFIDSMERSDVYTYRAQQCHRNLSLVLAEMAERHYKKQYGLLLPSDVISNLAYAPAYGLAGSSKDKDSEEKDSSESLLSAVGASSHNLNQIRQKNVSARKTKSGTNLKSPPTVKFQGEKNGGPSVLPSGMPAVPIIVFGCDDDGEEGGDITPQIDGED